SALQKAYETGKLRIRLEVDDSLPHGVAIYGERFGRYPIDPTVTFSTNLSGWVGSMLCSLLFWSYFQ
ncbi:MAG: hypothetical protein QM518_11175, partial [Verrucomicrobiota bacterium]|nr:hypothetical protein [Verrucomicrobiota bacterium]